MRATENLARKLKIDERAIRAAVAVEDGGGDSPDYLCFTAVDGDASVSMMGMNEGGGEVTTAPTIYYSFDKVTWTSWIENYAGAAINLTNGQSVYMYGENPNGIADMTTFDVYIFQMTGKVAASGNIQTLLSKEGDRMDVPVGAFCGLFLQCTSLTTAPTLPATTLTEYCYAEMFSGCTSLTTAPALPATTLAESCYYEMFNGCTSLTTAPALPATTLAISCYSSMFKDCTSLTTAPSLPATTLAESCYYEMFNGCTSLTTAPALPATTLAENCYHKMFNGCTSLTTAPALPATTLAISCYSSMFKDCTSLTTAPALPATTLEDSCYIYMFQGCTSLTTAPALPATTLVNGCYYSMFIGCSNLQSVTTYATQWNTTYAFNWLQNAGTNATNPTIYCPADSTIPSSNNSGIPTGWTRADLPTE